MNINKIIRILSNCIMFAALSCSSLTLAQNNERNTLDFHQIPKSYWFRDQSKWINAPWTEGDKPYTEIRRYIDAEVAAGTLTPPLIETMGTMAAKKRYQDPLAVFRWAYADYRAERMLPPMPLRHYIARGAFEQLPDPSCYEMVRMRFLINTIHAGDSSLIPLGKRLLNKNPHDADVMYSLIDCYEPGESVQQEQEALYYATQFIHEEPDYRNTNALFGSIYYRAWFRRRTNDDAKNAVREYGRYLDQVPQNDYLRPSIERVVSYVVSHQK